MQVFGILYLRPQAESVNKFTKQTIGIVKGYVVKSYQEPNLGCITSHAKKL
jgi:hypothetical protein